MAAIDGIAVTLPASLADALGGLQPDPIPSPQTEGDTQRMHLDYAVEFDEFRSAVLDQQWSGFWQPRALAFNAAFETGLALAIDEVFEVGSLAFVAFFVSFALLVSLAFGIVAARLVARRRYRQYSDLQGRISLVVEATGLTITAKTFQSRILWSALTRWRETKRAVLLYQANSAWLVVPKRVLAEELSSLTAIAARAGLAGVPKRPSSDTAAELSTEC